jgi:hypothetical protein
MGATKKGQIDSAKVVIGEVFSRSWFRIPITGPKTPQLATARPR